MTAVSASPHYQSVSVALATETERAPPEMQIEEQWSGGKLGHMIILIRVMYM